MSLPTHALTMHPAAFEPWWRSAVIYQIYPRSFKDSNGDGVGDIRGITESLDYIASLDVGAIWLNPTYPSPNTDWGYDVADYFGVHPELGSVEDMEELIREAEKRGIRILLDLVPNHTSHRHPWFLDALSAKDAAHRDWYVFAPGRDGGPPNNWLNVIQECAWVEDDATKEWYLHNFLPTQPDLNWWNPAVREEFERILRFWFDRGVAGFRIDVAHGVVKDRELRDNPEIPAGESADRYYDAKQIPLYNAHRPEVHEIYRAWRKIAASYPDERLLYGETYALSSEETASYYGEGDELQLTLNGPSIHIPPTVADWSSAVRDAENDFGPQAWPSWTGSNHDVSRFPTRWAHGDSRLSMCYLMMLLTLRGTPVMYYGDELAMPDTVMDPALWKDPMHVPGQSSRDRSRTPMPWNDSPGAGFTDPRVTPWLPFGDLSACTVEAQLADPRSPLRFAQRLLAFRSSHTGFTLAPYKELHVGETSWAWARDPEHYVAINFGKDADFQLPSGTIVVANDPDLEGTDFAGSSLPPASAVIVRRSPA